MHALALNIVLIAQMLVPLPAGNNPPTAPPATQPVAQQANSSATTPPAKREISIRKIFSGEETLDPEDLKNFDALITAGIQLAKEILSWIPKVFVAFLFLIVFWFVYRGIRRLVLGSMSKAHVDESIRDMLGALIKWGIMGFGLVIAFNQVGIQITALLTGVSIIGLAIGFAAQETLANFIAGVVIFWDRPFRVGDWVAIEDVFGQVQRITFRSTRILNLDGEVIVFPNTYMLAHKVGNHSTNPVNRLTVKVGIAYKESIDDARRALLALIGDDPRICKDPAPRVVVAECGDSSVNLLFQFWIEDESLERTMGYEFTEKAKTALDQAGIQIPFPHMQLILEKSEALAALGLGGPGGAGKAA